jgi:hypothetical protein
MAGSVAPIPAAHGMVEEPMRDPRESHRERESILDIERRERRTMQSQGMEQSSFCRVCAQVTAMEVVREHDGDGLVWARCLVCGNVFPSRWESAADRERRRGGSGGLCTRPYSPANDFAVGDRIFHEAWNDVGVVLSKRPAGGGRSAITVRFDRLGHKTLAARDL